jgi:hypothetical protein
MDFKLLGTLSIKLLELRLCYDDALTPSHFFYSTIALGPQKLSTCSKSAISNKINLQDTMKFLLINEEIFTIATYAQSSTIQTTKIGSAVIPLQSVVLNGSYKGTITLMSRGKITINAKIELNYEKNFEMLFEYPRTVYSLPPPDYLHVHACNVPFNFGYTPPSYYFSKHEPDGILN